MKNIGKKKVRIHSWNMFERAVRSKGCKLLSELDRFPNSVLVTGCQRSGTTMLARIITTSEGMVNYWSSWNNELDGALILCGYVKHQSEGRYCFQTTYLNECYREYYEHAQGHKIIWVLRNPYSVVYSLLHNWPPHALNRLFKTCGAHLLNGLPKFTYNYIGIKGITRLHRACLAYNGKLGQLESLKEQIEHNRLLIVDYDDIVNNSHLILPAIYDFIDLKYYTEYAEKIHSKSINKIAMQSKKESSLIERLCMPVYTQARHLLSDITANYPLSVIN